ncbi:MAG TPA: MBL fold metallo-hydrolase [Tepidisphaeraceae bacterium]|nr:MBL fold metallo-hydrolase [Tepidisphaeraceae bacterium]
MRIQFCGANRTVTGSCHLIEVNGLRLFLDMGMYQGRREEARRINQYLPQDAHAVDAIILSHGHLDHCGKLPVVVRAGFTGPIYCTPATADVARTVLLDAGEIQEEDAEYLNRRSRDENAPRVEPLFRLVDAQATLKQFRRVKYETKQDVGNGVSFTFFDAGHILGSAYVLLEWTEAGKPRTLLFTGDIGRYGSPILRDPHPLPFPVDHVITESTYGDRTHAPGDQIGPQLLDAVRHCVERRSRLLVPSFAVGRTQTVLWYMHKFIAEGSIPRIPIFIDSPMGVEVTKATAEHRDLYDEETTRLLEKSGTFSAVFASSSAQSRQINAHSGACVIIASSPTCEFGRILHHLKRSVEQKDDVIVFVGWTPHHTLGRRLQEGQRRVRIYDRWYELRCGVRTIHGLSAHADADELLRFLQPTLKPQTTAYVVHGEPDEAEGLARRLLAAGIGQAHVPAIESSVLAISAECGR